jgi:hypothetical protein
MFYKIPALLLIVLPMFTNAQLTEKVTIKAGEDVTAVLATHGLYLFPSFNTTEVKFKNGGTTKAKMNFNVYMNKAQFIDDKGDTLVLNKLELIDSILFDSATFYYQDGYKQVIESGNNAMLILDRKISFDFRKRGALGLPASAGATVETIGEIFFAGYNGEKRLIADEDITAIKQSSYFIIYDKNRKAAANYAGFLSAFPGLKKEIKDFSDTHKISYKNETDLKEIFKFCLNQPKI